MVQCQQQWCSASNNGTVPTTKVMTVPGTKTIIAPTRMAMSAETTMAMEAKTMKMLVQQQQQAKKTAMPTMMATLTKQQSPGSKQHHAIDKKATSQQALGYHTYLVPPGTWYLVPGSTDDPVAKPASCKSQKS